MEYSIADHRDTLSIIFSFLLKSPSNLFISHRSFYAAALVCRCWREVALSCIDENDIHIYHLRVKAYISIIQKIISKFFWKNQINLSVIQNNWKIYITFRSYLLDKIEIYKGNHRLIYLKFVNGIFREMHVGKKIQPYRGHYFRHHVEKREKNSNVILYEDQTRRVLSRQKISRNPAIYQNTESRYYHNSTVYLKDSKLQSIERKTNNMTINYDYDRSIITTSSHNSLIIRDRSGQVIKCRPNRQHVNEHKTIGYFVLTKIPQFIVNDNTKRGFIYLPSDNIPIRINRHELKDLHKKYCVEPRETLIKCEFQIQNGDIVFS